MEKRFIHFLYCPLLGLGLYGGHRGSRWLSNRIKILKQFVVPSLLNQTNKNFVLWISVRPEDKRDPQIIDLVDYFANISDFKTVFTYSGVVFYDDKYENKEARNRLLTSLHGSIGELLDTIGEVDYVYWTIQPSDDVYAGYVVDMIQNVLGNEKIDALGFNRGYMMNYLTKEVAEYNPKTNTPFVSIKFPKNVFIDPLKHAEFTSIKKSEGGYEVGCPCPSHEYYPNVFGDKYLLNSERNFLVGCHDHNISTVFSHPYRGEYVSQDVLNSFGLQNVDKLVLPFSLRAVIFRKLSYGIKRKLRYWASEKRWILRPLFALIYNFLRS